MKFQASVLMGYEAERGNITMAFCGDIMPSRRLTVYREPEFLALRDLLLGTDSRFANLESSVLEDRRFTLA